MGAHRAPYVWVRIVAMAIVPHTYGVGMCGTFARFTPLSLPTQVRAFPETITFQGSRGEGSDDCACSLRGPGTHQTSLRSGNKKRSSHARPKTARGGAPEGQLRRAAIGGRGFLGRNSVAQLVEDFLVGGGFVWI